MGERCSVSDCEEDPTYCITVALWNAWAHLCPAHAAQYRTELTNLGAVYAIRSLGRDACQHDPRSLYRRMYYMEVGGVVQRWHGEEMVETVETGLS